MASTGRVALVTGGNRGIGLEIVRQLCRQFEGTVILSARSLEHGEEVRKELESEGLRPSLLQLDVCSEESIKSARDAISERHGRLDVLVNNAAILLRKDSGMSFSDIATETIRTNYHGIVKLTNALSPLLQANSRIVNLSSGLGNIKKISARRQKEILDPDMTVEKLSQIMDEFVRDAQSMADYDSKGWINKSQEYAAYSVSKIGVSRLTELLVETLGKDPAKPGLLINTVCPGWVRTQMGTMAASKSVEQGADTPVYLTLLPPGTNEPNGLFLRDRKPAKWK